MPVVILVVVKTSTQFQYGITHFHFYPCKCRVIIMRNIIVVLRGDQCGRLKVVKYYIGNVRIRVPYGSILAADQSIVVITYDTGQILVDGLAAVCPFKPR